MDLYLIMFFSHNQNKPDFWIPEALPTFFVALGKFSNLSEISFLIYKKEAMMIIIISHSVVGDIKWEKHAKAPDK